MDNSFRLQLNPFVVISVIFFFSNLANAQPNTSRAIDIDFGLGISTSYYENVDVTSSGVYLSGEYVLPLSSWFGFRPYAAFIMTWPDKDNDNSDFQNYSITSKAFMMGTKARLVAPIPWVAPYIESGIGFSLGSFESFIPFNRIQKNGFVYHIPFTLGLILGPDHNFDVNFSYYFHPSLKQINGAAAIGLSIPLNQNK